MHLELLAAYSTPSCRPPTEQPLYSVVDRPFSAGVALYYCLTTPVTTALRLVFTTASGLLLRRVAHERAEDARLP